MGFPTNAQRSAINSRGTTLVSAAAGSGKTAVLVERIIECMLDEGNPTDIDRMLVVTFTTAAAAEMKERVSKRISQKLEEDPGNPRLLQQQMLLEKANISTVDSFCKNLISQHFEQLELPPDFSIISAPALALLKAEALDETLDHFLETQPEETKELAVHLGSVKTLSPLETAVTLTYDFIRSLPFPDLWLEQAKEHYDSFTTPQESCHGKALKNQGKNLVLQAIPILEEGLAELATVPNIKPKRWELLTAGLEQLNEVLPFLEQDDWDAMVAKIKTLQKVSFSGGKFSDDETVKQLTVSLQSVCNNAMEFLKEHLGYTVEECVEQNQLAQKMITTLFAITKEFSNRLQEKKREQNLLDFADLEYAALSLLMEVKDGEPTPTPLADEIAQTFDYVMVDEFQDSNDLQNALYQALSSGGKNLFTVGDIKQSIYRFRKANPRNFSRLLETYPPYSEETRQGTVVLDGNFRSRPEICGVVNHFFSLVMSKEAGDITYDHTHALTAANEDFPPLESPVTLEFLEKDNRSNEEVEADRIAHHIKELMNTPCVTDKKTNTLRNATPEDCVILLRSHKKIASSFVKRLQEHGIPAVSPASDGFFEKREIRVALAILKTINNPADDLSLLAALLSPFFGFTPGQVAALRTNNFYGSLYANLKTAGQAGDPQAQACLNTLQSLRLYAATHSPAMLLESLYYSHHFLALVQLWNKGESRKQNLLSLLSLAQEGEKNGIDRLDALLRYFKKIEDDEGFLPETTSQQQKGVQVISVHASKGLQYPICFLAGCSKKPNYLDRADPVALDEKLGVGISIYRNQDSSRTDTIQRKAVTLENDRCDTSEELRILYVAMTRAVDRLYLFDTQDDLKEYIAESAGELMGNLSAEKRLNPNLVLSANNFGKLFSYFALLHPSGNFLRLTGNVSHGYLPANDKELVVATVSADQNQPPCVKEDSQPQTRTPDDTLLHTITESLSYQSPFAPLEHLLAKQSVSALTHQSHKEFRVPRPAFLQEKGLTSAEKGTALHEFMQYADYTAAAADPKGEVERLVALAFLTPKQGEVIDTAKVSAFFHSPLYQRMTESAKVLREHRFMAALPVTQIDPTLDAKWSNETTITQGIVDCMFEENDGFVVVDYKTDKVKTPEELVERYQKQLTLYAKLLKESSDISVKELLIYSFHLEKEIPVPFTE